MDIFSKEIIYCFEESENDSVFMENLRRTYPEMDGFISIVSDNSLLFAELLD